MKRSRLYHQALYFGTVPSVFWRAIPSSCQKTAIPDDDEYGTPTKGPFGITPMIDENTQEMMLAPLNRKPLQHLFAGPRFLRNKDDIRLFSISLPPKKAL
jgi:hypothetical protein